MTTRAMSMPVLQFFLRGGSYLFDGDIEVQCFTRERMVAIDGDLFLGHLCDNDKLCLTIFTGRFETHAGLDLVDTLERIARHGLDEFFVDHTVSVFRLDRDIERSTDILARQFILETGDDVAGTMQVDEGLRPFRRIEGFPCVVRQLVVDGYDTLSSDLQDVFLLWGIGVG